MTNERGFSIISGALIISIMLGLLTIWLALLAIQKEDTVIFNAHLTAKEVAKVGLLRTQVLLSQDRNWSDNTGVVFSENFNGGTYQTIVSNASEHAATITYESSLGDSVFAGSLDVLRSVNSAFDLAVTTANAQLSLLNTHSVVSNISVVNTSSSNAVSISGLYVTWHPQDPNASLVNVSLGGQSVFSGTALSGSFIDISDFILNPLQSQPLSLEVDFDLTGDLLSIYFVLGDTSIKQAGFNQFEQLGVGKARADSFAGINIKHKNEGANPYLVVDRPNQTKTFIRFSDADIENALNGGAIQSAIIRFTIYNTDNKWDHNGNYIGLYPLTMDWVEGNGADTLIGDAIAIQGSGSGMTWRLAVDLDISNNQNDPGIEWELGESQTSLGHPWTNTPTDMALITDNMVGTIEFDVTNDLSDMAVNNYGWLIKLEDYSSGGEVIFYSKEGAVAPELIITYE